MKILFLKNLALHSIYSVIVHTYQSCYEYDKLICTAISLAHPRILHRHLESENSYAHQLQGFCSS